MFLLSDKCAFLLIIVGLLGVFHGAHAEGNIKCKAADGSEVECPAADGCKFNKEPQGCAVAADKAEPANCICNADLCNANHDMCKPSGGGAISTAAPSAAGSGSAAASGSESVMSHQPKFLFIVPALLALGRKSTN